MKMKMQIKTPTHTRTYTISRTKKYVLYGLMRSTKKQR